MVEFIRDFVKGCNPVAILRNKIVRGSFDVCLIDFLDKNDNFHSVRAAFNDSRIFSTGEGHLLGENNNDISAVLENNHKIFSTKEDYLAGRFTLPDEKEIAAYCESLQAGFTMSVYKGFVPSKITLCFKPVFCICFYFTLDGVEQNPLILIPGQKVECCSLYKENSADFIEFLRRNGLGQFIVEVEELPSMDCFILDGDEL